MNKILILLCCLISNIALAKEQVKIIWPFAPAVAYTNLLRTIELANRTQDKYFFVPEIRSGASGSIAAQHALRSNSLLGTSSSFVIRLVGKEETNFEFADFTPLYLMAYKIPLVMVSKKHKTMEEFNRVSDPTVGMSTIGGITHFVALTATKNKATAVPFKSVGDAMVATIGGHVDASVSFIEEVKSNIDKGNLHILGRTGTSSKDSFNKQKIYGLERLYTHYVIYAPHTMSKDKIKDFNEIFSKVGASDYVRDTFELDNVEYVTYNLTQTEQWFNNEKKFWSDFLRNK